jgi:hypothetical protein
MRRRRLCAALAALALHATGISPAAAQVAREPPVAALGPQVLPELVEGVRVAAAVARLEGSTGDPARDERLRQRVAEIGGTLRGVTLQRFTLEGVIQAVARLPDVAQARYSLYASVPAGQVVIVFEVVPSALPVTAPPGPEGLLATGRADALPVLYRDDHSLLKLILNGGAGGYATSNPFFGRSELFTRGNLAARDPAGPGTTGWAEAYVEPGIGGIGRVGGLPLYAYGAATYLASASWGQDIYDSGTRHHGAFEQAYGGILVDLPGKGNSLNVSAGRQIYQLRQGFLVSKIPGSTNLGSLGALWLGPRLAFDHTIIAKLKLGALSAEAIRLEPSEFPGQETGTRIEGATVGYADGRHVDAAVSYLRVPASSRGYLAPDGSSLGTRKGLETISPSLWLTEPFGLEGVWFKGEYARQTHEEIDMSARAYALWLGYRAEKEPWKPGISYKYTSFGGDDPATGRFERYDPLLAGGQNNYVPGMLLSSVLVNANLQSHRLTLTASPTPQLSLTAEYTVHRAEQLNNRGAIGPLQVLGSKALAREIDLFASLTLGKNYYIQGLLAAAMPDDAIKDALAGTAKNWLAVQLSAYYFF